MDYCSTWRPKAGTCPIADFQVFVPSTSVTISDISIHVLLHLLHLCILLHTSSHNCVCRAYRSPQLGKPPPLETLIGQGLPQRSDSPKALPSGGWGWAIKRRPPKASDWPIHALTGHVSLAWRALTANDRRACGERPPLRMFLTSSYVYGVRSMEFGGT
jgi:hypothetical protein